MAVQHGEQHVQVVKDRLRLNGIAARRLAVAGQVQARHRRPIADIGPRAPRHRQQALGRVGGGPQPAVHAKALAQPELDRQRLEHRSAVHGQRRDLAVRVQRQEFGTALFARLDVHLDAFMGHAQFRQRTGDGRGAGHGVPIQDDGHGQISVLKKGDGCRGACR
ncbi:hypothetical protein D3C72_1689810 [compost metagenome]